MARSAVELPWLGRFKSPARSSDQPRWIPSATESTLHRLGFGAVSVPCKHRESEARKRELIRSFPQHDELRTTAVHVLFSILIGESRLNSDLVSIQNQGAMLFIHLDKQVLNLRLAPSVIDTLDRLFSQKKGDEVSVQHPILVPAG